MSWKTNLSTKQNILEKLKISFKGGVQPVGKQLKNQFCGLNITSCPIKTFQNLHFLSKKKIEFSVELDEKCEFVHKKFCVCC